MITDEVVRDVATLLGTVQIEVMPFKGALLQHWLYDDPSDRPRTDVDLLVQPELLLAASACLTRAGYEVYAHSSTGAHVFRSPLGLAVDLHPRLFDRARYRLPTHDVFRRSAVDHSLFGVPVRLPSRLDAYAHLVGKFASDHRTARSIRALDELSRLGRTLEADPTRVARHLEATGMRRAAAYALAILSRSGDERAAAVLDRLDPDPLGLLVVAVAGRVLRVTSPTAAMGSVAAHAMNRSLPAAARSGVRALAHRFVRPA